MAGWANYKEAKNNAGSRKVGRIEKWNISKFKDRKMAE